MSTQDRDQQQRKESSQRPADQDEWLGSGPPPSRSTWKEVEKQEAKGVWSEQRQRSDFSGANQGPVEPEEQPGSVSQDDQSTSTSE